MGPDVLFHAVGAYTGVLTLSLFWVQNNISDISACLSRIILTSHIHNYTLTQTIKKPKPTFDYVCLILYFVSDLCYNRCHGNDRQRRTRPCLIVVFFNDVIHHSIKNDL